MGTKDTFLGEGDFRAHILDYIREHYGDMLGTHVSLLEQDGGLDRLMELVRAGKIGPRQS